MSGGGHRLGKRQYGESWTYAIFFRDGPGGVWRRLALGTTDRAVAGELYAQWIRERSQAIRPKSLTVGAIWAEYVKTLEGRPAGSAAPYAWVRLAPHFRDLAVVEVTEEVCAAYTKQRREMGRKDNGTATDLGRVRSALVWAEKKKLIDKAPFIWMPSRTRPDRVRLTREEFDRLRAEVGRVHLKLYLLLAISTAARPEAILELTWDRVSLDRGEIDFRDPGKSASRKGRAVVPMTGALRAALQEAYEGRQSRYVIEVGGDRITTVYDGIREAAKRAGIKGVTPYTIRHSAATWMAEAGASMEEIAQVMGHVNSRITESTYARFSPNHLRTALSALEIGGPVLAKGGKARAR